MEKDRSSILTDNNKMELRFKEKGGYFWLKQKKTRLMQLIAAEFLKKGDFDCA